MLLRLAVIPLLLGIAWGQSFIIEEADLRRFDLNDARLVETKIARGQKEQDEEAEFLVEEPLDVTTFKPRESPFGPDGKLRRKFRPAGERVRPIAGFRQQQQAAGAEEAPRVGFRQGQGEGVVRPNGRLVRRRKLRKRPRTEEPSIEEVTDAVLVEEEVEEESKPVRGFRRQRPNARPRPTARRTTTEAAVKEEEQAEEPETSGRRRRPLRRRKFKPRNQRLKTTTESTTTTTHEATTEAETEPPITEEVIRTTLEFSRPSFPQFQEIESPSIDEFDEEEITTFRPSSIRPFTSSNRPSSVRPFTSSLRPFPGVRPSLEFQRPTFDFDNFPSLLGQRDRIAVQTEPVNDEPDRQRIRLGQRRLKDEEVQVRPVSEVPRRRPAEEVVERRPVSIPRRQRPAPRPIQEIEEIVEEVPQVIEEVQRAVRPVAVERPVDIGRPAVFARPVTDRAPVIEQRRPVVSAEADIDFTPGVRTSPRFRPSIIELEESIVANQRRNNVQRPAPPPIDDESVEHVETVDRYTIVNDDGSTTFGYETADGSFREETRHIDCTVTGKYGYIDPDGERREYTYQQGIRCDPNAPKTDEELQEFEEDPRVTEGRNRILEAEQRARAQQRQQQQFRPRPAPVTRVQQQDTRIRQEVRRPVQQTFVVDEEIDDPDVLIPQPIATFGSRGPVQRPEPVPTRPQPRPSTVRPPSRPEVIRPQSNPSTARPPRPETARPQPRPSSVRPPFTQTQRPIQIRPQPVRPAPQPVRQDSRPAPQPVQTSFFRPEQQRREPPREVRPEAPATRPFRPAPQGFRIEPQPPQILNIDNTIGRPRQEDQRVIEIERPQTRPTAFDFDEEISNLRTTAQRTAERPDSDGRPTIAFNPVTRRFEPFQERDEEGRIVSQRGPVATNARPALPGPTSRPIILQSPQPFQSTVRPPQEATGRPVAPSPSPFQSTVRPPTQPRPSPQPRPQPQVTFFNNAAERPQQVENRPALPQRPFSIGPFTVQNNQISRRPEQPQQLSGRQFNRPVVPQPVLGTPSSFPGFGSQPTSTFFPPRPNPQQQQQPGRFFPQPQQTQQASGPIRFFPGPPTPPQIQTGGFRPFGGQPITRESRAAEEIQDFFSRFNENVAAFNGA